MTDFHAYIPYVNRPDLLKRAVDSVPELWENLTILDNSGYGIDTELPDSVQSVEPPVPLSFTQSQNFFFKDAKRRGCKFAIWLHSDSQIPDGAAVHLIERVHDFYFAGKKWGVAFTYYDILSAVNLAMVDDVGGYDTNILSYVSDQDFYHRVKLKGWELINTEIEVESIKNGHLGSQTIRSDERLSLMNGITQTMANFYFDQKWGGEPGKETYACPFNRPDLFGGV